MRTLLKNGIIMDGSGKSSYQGSVLVEDSVIKEVVKGDFTGSFDGKVIDCSGKVIAPGFIDAHSHNDWFAARNNTVPYFKSFAEQGITTQVTGNCGFSPFGYEAGTKYIGLLGSGLFETGEVYGDYSSFNGWREAAEQRTPLNIIPLQGHGSIRIGISGYDNRPLSEKEMARRNAKLEEAFDQGVYGLSFGLMYEPDRYAAPDELEMAARIVAKRGGILTVHSKAQSAVSTSYNLSVGGEPHNLRALKEMIELTRRTGVRMQYSHHIFVGKTTWKTVDRSLELIDQARAEGLDFAYDLYSMTFGVSVITVILPNWFLSLPEEKKAAWLAKKRLAFEIGLTKRLLGFGFQDIQVAWAGDAAESICGKYIAELAKEWKMKELDAYIKVVEMCNGKGRVNMYRYYNEETICKLAKHAPSLFMTDAWIEEKGVQNAAAFSSFPKFLELSRGNKTISMEETIRKMTGATADRFMVKNRGYLRKDYAADITVFDPKTVSANGNLPVKPEGIHHVFVNGISIVENGMANERLMKGSGTVLLKQP